MTSVPAAVSAPCDEEADWLEEFAVLPSDEEVDGPEAVPPGDEELQAAVSTATTVNDVIA